MSRKPNSIPPRWLDCPRKGLPIHKFVPFKTPLDSRYDDQVSDRYKFDIDMLLMSCRGAKIDIGFIIDLTNTSRFYDKSVVESNDIRYLKLQCRGHGETPSEEQTALFINVCDHYIRQNPLKHIGIHCTHGFNRTGFLIIAFLVEKLDWSIDAAVTSFSRCRPPGIYKQDYLGELYRRYGGDIDSAPSAPALPEWCTEPEDQYDDGTPVPTSLMMGKRPISDEGERPPSKRKKEMDRKDAQFMDGKVDGVHPVNDPQVREQVQRKAQDMCRWKSSGFPGSQPVSMDRANLQKLAEKPYKVSWKADGMRYLMLIDGNRRNYMLDRDNQVFQVPNLTFPRRKDLDACIENTLVDGEMIMDVVNGADVPRFLIYDIIKFENVDVGGADFDRRLLCINKEIIGPRHQKIQEGRLDKARETISIRIKPFWDVTYAQQLMDGKFSKQVSHETDGLIFQPAKDAYKAGRCDETLKWKPPDMNSVDFKLTITTEQQTGCLPTTKGLLWVGGYNKPFAQMKVTNQLRQFNNKIIECSFDGENNCWVFMRQRTDKSFPNAYKTAIAVCESIRNPVTKEILYDFIEFHRWKPMDRDLMPPPPGAR